MTTWSLERAQEHLLSLELFGMRFGLERMHRLLEALGSPQRRLRAVHVVGTNGKSSVTRMTSAILERHGQLTGAYVSPHLESFAERIRIAGADLDSDAFGAAIQRVAYAAERIGTGGAGDEPVTQFELLTAAALSEFAERGVDVAVVEAGLGGRLDATNVLSAPVVVLTSVGLEHTAWLGETEDAIAQEKLAVLGEGATLVCGPLGAEAMARAEQAAAGTHARLVRVSPEDAPEGLELPGYQRGNFAIARAAAEAILGATDPAAVMAAAADAGVPGRLQVTGGDPLVIFDGAHNPDGIRALSAALDELVGSRPLVLVASILSDKDPAAMLSGLLGRCRAAVLTEAANPRALPASDLLAAAPRGTCDLHAEPDPRRALERARALAGPDGAVLVSGSLHLVGDLLADPGRRVVSAR